MIKTLAFLTRKPTLSRAEFIEQYETGHALLGVKLMPSAKRYLRRYLKPVDEGFITPDFDVVTEVWFEDEAACAAAMAALMTPETAAIIAEDEEKLFDRTKSMMATVVEHETNLSEAPAWKSDHVKFLAFLPRKSGMPMADFIDYYDTSHAPFATQYLKGKATRYFRRFLQPSAYQGEYDAGKPGFDVVTEVWFRSLKEMRELHAEVSKPEIAALFAEDEENLFDRNNFRFALVDEFESNI